MQPLTSTAASPTITGNGKRDRDEYDGHNHDMTYQPPSPKRRALRRLSMAWVTTFVLNEKDQQVDPKVDIAHFIRSNHADHAQRGLAEDSEEHSLPPNPFHPNFDPQEHRRLVESRRRRRMAKEEDDDAAEPEGVPSYHVGVMLRNEETGRQEAHTWDPAKQSYRRRTMMDDLFQNATPEKRRDYTARLRLQCHVLDEEDEAEEEEEEDETDEEVKEDDEDDGGADGGAETRIGDREEMGEGDGVKVKVKVKEEEER